VSDLAELTRLVAQLDAAQRAQALAFARRLAALPSP
jgi:hypothetical protein